MQSAPRSNPASAPDPTRLAEDFLQFTLVRSGLPHARLVELVREHLRHSDDPGALWGLAASEGDLAKAQIETRSGPAYTSEALAARLGCTAQTIRNRVATGQVIAYSSRQGRGALRLPAWQFSPGLTPLPWVAPLLAAYGGAAGGGWGLLDFLTVPRTEPSPDAPSGDYVLCEIGPAEGYGAASATCYLDWLKAGHVEQVLAAARRHRAD